MPSRVLRLCSDGRPSNHQNAVHRQASSQPVRNVRSASASILEYPHRLHWRWRFLPANFLSTGFRMISTTSPTVRRWCVFASPVAPPKRPGKPIFAGLRGLPPCASLLLPLASAQAEAAHAEQASPTTSHAHSALQTRHGTSCVPLRCEMCRPQGCGRPPHVAYTPSPCPPIAIRQVASCFPSPPQTSPRRSASSTCMGLRQRALVTAPNIFVSAQVAAWTDDKARYIRNRGLDDSYYRELIVDLKRYGQADKIDALLLPKLPDVLDATTGPQDSQFDAGHAARRHHL